LAKYRSLLPSLALLFHLIDGVAAGTGGPVSRAAAAQASASGSFGMAALPSVWARSWLSWSLAEVGEFAEAAAIGEEAAEIATSADHPYSHVQAFFGLGMLYVIQGRH